MRSVRLGAAEGIKKNVETVNILTVVYLTTLYKPTVCSSDSRMTVAVLIAVDL